MRRQHGRPLGMGAARAGSSGGGGAMPLWRVGAVVNTWLPIAGTSMSDLSASLPVISGVGAPNKIIGAWGGLTLDRRFAKVYSLAAGGHGDWFGNQVLSLDLSQNAPAWVLAQASDSAANVIASMPNVLPRYPTTGNPASSHTYYSEQYIEQRNRAIRFAACGVADSGYGTAKLEAFGSTWDAVNTFADAPSGDGYGVCDADMPTCKDPATGNVYMWQQNYTVRKWTQATNTWSTHGIYSPVNFIGPCAFDTVRNRILLIPATSTAAYYFDTTTNTYTGITLNVGSSGYAPPNMLGVGMVYDDGINKFVLALETAGGNNLYFIDPVTWLITKPTLSGGGSIPQTFDLVGTNQNVYNKIQYAPTLNGIVYIPSYETTAWFLRTV